MRSDTRFSVEHLEQLARNRVSTYLEELSTCPDDVLTDDDLCSAADQAKLIFLEHTSWSIYRCRERAWEIAEPIYNRLKR